MVLLFSTGITGTLGVYSILPMFLVSEHGMSEQSANMLVGLSRSTTLITAFLGGVLGGLVLGAYGTQGVYLMCAAVIVVWLLIMLPAKPPKLLDTRVLRFADLESQGKTLAAELSAIEGVIEVILMAPQGVVYVKVDSELLDPQALDKYETAAGN